MAGSQSLTAREVAGEVMASEHADPLRESVAAIVREIMQAEIAQVAGAELRERAPERRNATGIASQWDTRVGKIELAIPRLRTGGADGPAGPVQRPVSRMCSGLDEQVGAFRSRQQDLGRRPASTIVRPAPATTFEVFGGCGRGSFILQSRTCANALFAAGGTPL